MINLTSDKVRFIGIILLVVFVGLALFSAGLALLYKEALELGACGLCQDLNPDVLYCFKNG